MKPYENSALFADCARAAQDQAESRNQRDPPGTASSRASMSSRASVSARRALKMAVATASSSLYEDVWTGLAAWVSSQLERGRAVNVPHFFKIAFTSKDGVRPLSVRSNSPRGTSRGLDHLGDPVFILSDEFIQEHKVVFRMALPPGASLATGVATVDLQYSAVSQVCGVDKDTCQALLKALFYQLGLMMARGALVEVTLPGSGVISAANKCVGFIPTDAVNTRTGSRAGSPRNNSPRATSPRRVAPMPAPGSRIGGVMQPREELRLSVTPAPSMGSRTGYAAGGGTATPAATYPTPTPPATPPPQFMPPAHTSSNQNNDSFAAATAMIHRKDRGVERPHRMRGQGLVPTMDNLGHYGAKGVAAYPKFLLPERGVFVNPAPGGGSALPGPAAAAASKAYERYQVQLAQGVETTQRQLQAIDDRWKDAIKTDEMKVELMRAKNGEVNTFLQKQMLEKQARAEHERRQRLNTPDTFARTGYPAINSPSRDIRARVAAKQQQAAQRNALQIQIETKQKMNKHAQDRSVREELGKLQEMARQMQEERNLMNDNEQLTRATLKDSWERHAALKNIERRMTALEEKG
eukprot:COSAG05_NODE_172_length_14980_cov_10.662791_5_plen_581_part_00